MSAVLDMVEWIGTVTQSGGIRAGTIQSAQQLVWFGRAVTAIRIVGKRWMSYINTGIEHGNDDAFTPGAGAPGRHSGAIPNLIGANELRTAKGRCVIHTFALNRLDTRQSPNSLRFLRSQARSNPAMRHQEIVRHIQVVTEGSSHRLNMAGLFPHHLRAQRLCLRRIGLKTLTVLTRLPLQHSFLRELDHVAEPAVIVGGRILHVTRGHSVSKACRRGAFRPNAGSSVP